MDKMDQREQKFRENMQDTSQKTSGNEGILLRFLSSLLAMYILTGILLFVMALLLYRLQLSEAFVTIGVMVSYVVSSFFGGLLLGWRMKATCAFLGLLIGCAYFLVLFVGSVILNHGLPADLLRMAAVWMMCGCGGMLGGMLYPGRR